ncbi:ArdC family protein [Phycisphaera mikurensis]|uniref:Antirestriction protein n=1 Tax=Phycisphaera mikurensis (strain NBRC 102666 / KCTC 22515 / FYK2301M01) TaxID=1142394 RepID=I0IJD8_PHYMF|nr:ArdC-like ssDNA-binding domain-containing protein [Phycisphaera mikurensis]MBB6443204.1 antirestriction protein ArdC [Phycisphaera mikurensis]BAM05376.1 antirestriction protein [Phycisphaera mikurensis NBRC 102666]
MSASVSRSSSTRTRKPARKDAPKPRRDIAQEVTDRIVEALTAGTVPWRPQHTGTESGFLPANLVTGKKYRGVNVFLLWLAERKRGFTRPLWMTYRQAAQAGGQVRAGSKSVPIVFWNFMEKEDKKNPSGEKKRVAFLKTYNVFNVEDVDGLDTEAAPGEVPLEPDACPPELRACAEVATGFLRSPGAPGCVEMEVTPHYNCRTDVVVTPPLASYETPEAYFSTLFHEIAHSTGHASRLGRRGITEAGSGLLDPYAEEEMVAELAASLLCAHCGIAPVTEEMSAAYVAGWLDRMQTDSGFFLKAAGAAQKAVDLIRPAAEDRKTGPE